jgi:hypothetical protein
LTAQNGDGVSWRNDTGDGHIIWRLDREGGEPVATVTPGGRGTQPRFDGRMTDPIAPRTPPAPYTPSSERYTVAEKQSPTKIYYCCLLHPNEKGQINVIDSFG